MRAGPDTLGPVAGVPVATGSRTSQSLRDAARSSNLQQAEKAFAPFAGQPALAGLDALMEMVDDGAEAHRTVLVAKSLELAGFVGTPNAHALLRQSIHYCVKNKASAGYLQQCAELRRILPALLEKHQLLSRL